MQEYEATVTEKGQVTIPQEIRHLIGLHPRDRVRFTIEGDSVKVSRAESKLLAGFKAVKPLNQPEDYARIREQVEEEIAKDVASEA